MKSTQLNFSLDQSIKYICTLCTSQCLHLYFFKLLLLTRKSWIVERVETRHVHLCTHFAEVDSSNNGFLIAWVEQLLELLEK